jgi:AcrR family transcriptional regulator
VDATYRIIARTASINPTVREIIAEAGVSTQAFYRHFRSKDELLAVLLDDGRRRIVDYLAHRMSKVDSPVQQVREFVEGVMAQAIDAAAAARTRPFIVQQDRLADQFEAYQRESIDRIVELLEAPLRAIRPGPTAADDARTVYQLAFSSMGQHVRDRTVPSAFEIENLVSFVLRGIGAETLDQ